jgi:hypothetical protein
VHERGWLDKHAHAHDVHLLVECALLICVVQGVAEAIAATLLDTELDELLQASVELQRLLQPNIQLMLLSKHQQPVSVCWHANGVTLCSKALQPSSSAKAMSSAATAAGWVCIDNTRLLQPTETASAMHMRATFADLQSSVRSVRMCAQISSIQGRLQPARQTQSKAYCSSTL